MNKLQSLMGLTAAVLAATFMPPAHAQTANPKPVKVISSLPTLTSAATYLMSARGFDKKFGMAVDITQSGASSTIQVDAVLSGSAAFGHPGTATALQAIREGADIQIVGAITNNQIAAVISNDALKKSGLALNAPIADRIKALKGMTIGTNPEGSTYALMLRLYLQEQGINPDKDVRLVGIAESSALITGMEQGRYDAIVSASGVVEQAISQKLGQLWFSGARGDIPGSEKSVVAVIITHTNTVKNNPELVIAYRNAMNESLKALRQDHAGAGKTLQEKHFSKMDPALWNEVWTNTTNAYPTELKFTRSAYDFWITNDPKGAASFSKVDYSKVVIPEAQEK